MKSSGIVRPIDNLGRVTLPIELRRALGLSEGTGLEICLDGKNIILRKFSPCCIFCGDADNLILYNDTHICRDCATAIGDEAK